MLTTLHTVLLFGFVGVTSLLMLMTVANRMRVKRVALSWQTGPLFGMPLWPTLFLLIVGGFLLHEGLTSADHYPGFFVGYLMGGTFWFVAVWFASSVLVTDYGLLYPVQHNSRAVAWGQIVDYFVVGQGPRERYVFFYLDERGVRQRMNLSVPPAHRERFRQIVAARLDARFEFYVQQAYGKKALEG